MSRSLPKSAIIIGAGIGGIATAALLARAGVKVTMFDALPKPGGRANWHEAEGFGFDMGPSWFLMPEVFEHYYHLIGKDMHTELDLVRLDPAYKVFFEDTTQAPIEIHGDLERDAETFENIETGAGKALRKYIARAESTYFAATTSFLYTNFERYTAFLRPSVLKSVPRILWSSFQSIDTYVSRFVRTRALKQILEYPMVFLGTSPYNAPSLFHLMSYMDFSQGVFYPKGGMYTIISSLTAIANEYGVELHNNAEVSKIIVEDGRAVGVRIANGEEFRADIVISNADMYHTEMKLLDRQHRTYPEQHWDKQLASPSALLMYLGVKGTLPELTHHNLFFTNDWQKNFGDIFERKQWPKPASIYVCKPSATDSGVAPDGHENIFVLVPVPASNTTYDQEFIETAADAYLSQIAEQSGISDLKDRIVYKQFFSPNEFKSQYNAWQGTMLGPAHILKQSALWRTPNVSKKVKGLYYVGAFTTPGIGLPMCLISAELVYKRLIGDFSVGPIETPVTDHQT